MKQKLKKITEYWLSLSEFPRVLTFPFLLIAFTIGLFLEHIITKKKVKL